MDRCWSVWASENESQRIQRGWRCGGSAPAELDGYVIEAAGCESGPPRAHARRHDAHHRQSYFRPGQIDSYNFQVCAMRPFDTPSEAGGRGILRWLRYVAAGVSAEWSQMRMLPDAGGSPPAPERGRRTLGLPAGQEDGRFQQRVLDGLFGGEGGG